MEYNCRLLDYLNGQHLTFYQQTISNNKNHISKNFTKSYQNEERTEEQKNHCLKVSSNNTKNQIYKIARSETWDWFITLTFDRKITDSSDYDIVVNKLTKYLNNIRVRKCPNIKYLIVPELHSDGTHYHFHGLLKNCDNLHFKFSGKYKQEHPIYNILDWSFGFTTATRVVDTKRVSCYITKYITKESAQVLKNKKRYYSSRNINVAEAQYFMMDKEEFEALYADKIVYVKEVKIKEAHQKITYYELID